MTAHGMNPISQLAEVDGMSAPARHPGPGSYVMALLVLFGSLAGCRSSSVSPAYLYTGPSPLEATAPATSAPEPRVLLGAGDVIELKFFSVPELNDTQTIRPDGRIALQLVGDVVAQGRTPAELREDLNRLYTPLLKKPDVTVIVREFQDRKIYVGGEVLQPGMIPMPGSMTALEAIMQAGGFDFHRAAVQSVVIIRHKDGQRYGASLDFSDALAGKDYEPFELEPHDIVFIPQTRITKVAQWIDQHINQMIPVFGLAYSFPAGKGTLVIDTTRTRRSY
jgi:polysaccharide export outer membrane protein